MILHRPRRRIRRPPRLPPLRARHVFSQGVHAETERKFRPLHPRRIRRPPRLPPLRARHVFSQGVHAETERKFRPLCLHLFPLLRLFARLCFWRNVHGKTDAARGLSPRALHIHRLRQMPPAPQRLRLPSPLFFLRGVREKTAFPRDSRRLRRQLRNRNSRNRRKSAFRPPPPQEESLLWGFPRDGMKFGFVILCVVVLVFVFQCDVLRVKICCVRRVAATFV